MAININSVKYVLNNGKAPEGVGRYSFSLDQGDYIFTAPEWMTYLEACAWVRKILRRSHQDANLDVL
jgi:hypothetical protein